MTEEKNKVKDNDEINESDKLWNLLTIDTEDELKKFIANEKLLKQLKNNFLIYQKIKIIRSILRMKRQHKMLYRNKHMMQDIDVVLKKELFPIKKKWLLICIKKDQMYL